MNRPGTDPAPPPPLHTWRRPLRWGAGILWVAAFVATHMPARHIPAVGSDKLLHFVGYFVLAAALGLALLSAGTRAWKRRAVVVLVLGVYAAFDELTQPLVGRTASVGDWIANMAGVLTAVAAIELFAHLWRRRSARTR